MIANGVEIEPEATRSTSVARSVWAYKKESAAIAVLALAAYLGTLRFPFIYDDINQIVENPYLLSWHGALSYFKTDVWRALEGPHLVTNYYRPVFMLWLRLNYSLFGLSPFGWHLLAVLLHAVVAVLVLALTVRLTRNRMLGMIAAAIFAVHPIHVECVAWISGATEPLYCAFMLVSFLSYLNFRTPPEEGTMPPAKRRFWLGVSILSYLLSAFTKETALLLPGIIAAYEYLRPGEVQPDSRPVLSRIQSAVWIPISIYTAPTLIYIAARLVALRAFGRDVSSFPIGQNILIVPRMILFYMKALVFPVRRSIYYDVPVGRVSTFVLELLLLLVLAGVSWWLVQKVKESARRGQIVFCLVIVFLPLSPVLVLSLLPPGDPLHDRYLYLPSIGFSIISGMVLQMIPSAGPALFGLGRIRGAVVLLMLGVAGAGTAYACSPWGSDLVLYFDGVRSGPHNPAANNNLGLALLNRGYYAKAVPVLEDALKADPTYYPAMINLAACYSKMGHFDEAYRYATMTIRIAPTHAEGYYELAVLELSRDNYRAAEDAIDKAVYVQPDGKKFHYLRGGVYKFEGRLPEALEEFKRELALYPGEPEALKQKLEVEAALEKRPK